MFKITHFPQTDFQFNNFRAIDGSMKDMLKKFNTTETWIDVETLANLKGVSKRAIRLSFNSKNLNYETKIENGKGGKLYKIRLSSIEEDLQIKYIHEYYDTLATTNNIVELHEFKPKAEKIISFKQRELALAKYDLIKIWENYRLEQKQKGISKKVADSEFLTTYNTGLLYSRIFNVLEGFKFHWLRHTVCTRLVKQNVPLPIVKDVMTHSDIKTTMQYNHVDSLDMVNAMSVLDSYN